MLAGAPLRPIAGDLTRNTLFSLLLLGRHDDVASLCEAALSHGDDTALLAHATYAMAILNARLYEASRRDYDAAKSWIERSRKFTDSMPASAVRAVNAAFLMNTLALVEMRKGRAEVAEQTLAEALALMARDAPDLYAAESVILLHNMARLAVATGRAELAMEHLRTLLRQQPGDSGAWFDRGVIHQKAARHGQALADYDAAIRWEGAHAEAHFNRAQTLAALQRTGEAIAGYGRVLVLDPEFPDARLNRAVLSFERGDLASARDDIAAAMKQQPGNARALCMSGLIAMRMGDHDAALDAFARSIVADPGLADPWANRAIIAFRRGDLGAALDDLTRALELRDDAVIRCNRARIFEAKRQWQKAAADYSRARALDGADAASIERGTRRCMDALGRATSAISRA
jgi:tetratricopeptide (TPR) repeat protein